MHKSLKSTCNIFSVPRQNPERQTTKDKILLSISGGQDSICLLVILNQLSAQMEFKLGLVWCHHLWQIDSFSLMRQITKISYLFQLNSCFAITPKPIPSELLARNWRHDCSARICFFYNYYKMSLAHSASDKTETILLNLMRGTGLAGLSPLSWEKKNTVQNIKQREHVSQLLAFQVFFFIWSPFFLSQEKKKSAYHLVVPTFSHAHTTMHNTRCTYTCGVLHDAQCTAGHLRCKDALQTSEVHEYEKRCKKETQSDASKAGQGAKVPSKRERCKHLRCKGALQTWEVQVEQREASNQFLRKCRCIMEERAEKMDLRCSWKLEKVKLRKKKIDLTRFTYLKSKLGFYSTTPTLRYPIIPYAALTVRAEKMQGHLLLHSCNEGTRLPSANDSEFQQQVQMPAKLAKVQRCPPNVFAPPYSYHLRCKSCKCCTSRCMCIVHCSETFLRLRRFTTWNGVYSCTFVLCIQCASSEFEKSCKVPHRCPPDAPRRDKGCAEYLRYPL